MRVNPPGPGPHRMEPDFPSTSPAPAPRTTAPGPATSCTGNQRHAFQQAPPPPACKTAPGQAGARPFLRQSPQGGGDRRLPLRSHHLRRPQWTARRTPLEDRGCYRAQVPLARPGMAAHGRQDRLSRASPTPNGAYRPNRLLAKETRPCLATPPTQVLLPQGNTSTAPAEWAAPPSGTATGAGT